MQSYLLQLLLIVNLLFLFIQILKTKNILNERAYKFARYLYFALIVYFGIIYLIC